MSYRYRYKCTTEDLFVYENRKEYQSAPTFCYNNPNHTIDPTTVSLVSRISKSGDVVSSYENNASVEVIQLLHGSVSWVSGLIFDVTACEYIIDGRYYTSLPGQITLAAANGSNPRIDVLVANTSGVLTSVAGTPAASPVQPEINRNTQVFLAYVTVPTNSLTPSVVSNTIYQENSGNPTEWAAVENTSAARINVNSTNSPNAGTKCIEFTTAVDNDTITLTAPTAFDPSTLSCLRFSIKSKGSWFNTRKLLFTFYSGVVQVSDPVILKEGTLGFASDNTSTYQVISIPNRMFDFTTLSANILKITVSGGNTGIGLYLDSITWQSGHVINFVRAEANALNSVGTTGTSIAVGKVGSLLEVKSITASSNKISIVDNTSTNSIDLDVVPGNISHTTLANIGTNTHAQIDTHIADTTIHFTEASISHLNILNIGTNTHAQIDTHIATANIHYLQTAIDHTVILNRGTNTHAQIDSHIASTSNPHSVTIAQVSPLTTKGDLLTFSTVNTRLPVGANGLFLNCDSTAATGIAWTSNIGGQNKQIITIMITAPVNISNVTYASIGQFCWVQARHGGFTGPVVTFFATIGTRNVNVRVYNVTTASVLGTPLLVSATGFYAYSYPKPTADARLEFQCQKVSSGGTSPDINNAQWEFSF